MENNYYDLIISVIKQNKKYPACESIIDEIVEDVYSKAQTVFSNVSSESVLEDYITKLVTTSIISVSRKLGVDLRSKDTTPDVLEKIYSSQKKSVENESMLEADFDENISSDDEEDSYNETVISEEVIKEELFDDIENYIEDEDVIEEVSLDEGIDTVDDGVGEFCVEDEPDGSEPVIDITLVDKMINGVEDAPDKSEDKDEFFNILEQSSKDEDFESVDSDYNELEDLSVFETFADDSVEEFVANDVDNFSNEIIPEEIRETDSLELIELDQEFKNMSDSKLENDAVSIAEVNNNEDNVSEIIEIAEEDVEDSFVNDYPQELETKVQENNIEDVEFTSPETDNEQIIDKNFVVMDVNSLYENFEYEPESINYDSEEICKELLDFDEENPEKNILKICELKFYQNKTVSEIVELVQMPEDVVLDVLNEIINIVRDK